MNILMLGRSYDFVIPAQMRDMPSDPELHASVNHCAALALRG